MIMIIIIIGYKNVASVLFFYFCKLLYLDVQRALDENLLLRLPERTYLPQ